ncbi:MAG: hypothetical protein HQK83_17230 [Fibrobacteria bacterium]|nr:hypothetical protein [Fibrobacteria bacterium]
MKKIILTLLLLMMCENIQAKFSDGLLLILPSTKAYGCGRGMYHTLTEEYLTTTDRLTSLSSLSIVGIPNIMLIKNVLQKNPKNISFWRKFILWEEGIALGIFSSIILVDLINTNEDKYPSGERKDEEFLGPEFYVAMIAMSTGMWLLNFIPYSYEKISPQVSVDFFNINGRKSSINTSLSILYSF